MAGSRPERSDAEGAAAPAAQVFAYGSNLDAEDYARWCRERCQPKGNWLEARLATLPDHRLVFDYWSEVRGAGAANVEPASGHRVYGLVLSVDATAFSALDRKEGYPHVYDRAEHEVRLHAGGFERAWVYRVRPELRQDQFVPPSRHYLGLIRRAGRRLGFSADYLAWLATLPTREDRKQEPEGA